MTLKQRPTSGFSDIPEIMKILFCTALQRDSSRIRLDIHGNKPHNTHTHTHLTDLPPTWLLLIRLKIEQVSRSCSQSDLLYRQSDLNPSSPPASSLLLTGYLSFPSRVDRAVMNWLIEMLKTGKWGTNGGEHLLETAGWDQHIQLIFSPSAGKTFILVF